MSKSHRHSIIIASVLVPVAVFITVNLSISTPNNVQKQNMAWLQSQANKIFGNFDKLAPQPPTYNCSVAQKLIGDGCYVNVKSNLISNNSDISNYINLGKQLPVTLVNDGWTNLLANILPRNL